MSADTVGSGEERRKVDEGGNGYDTVRGALDVAVWFRNFAFGSCQARRDASRPVSRERRNRGSIDVGIFSPSELPVGSMRLVGAIDGSSLECKTSRTFVVGAGSMAGERRQVQVEREAGIKVRMEPGGMAAGLATLIL
jgi:hypothetical protein